MLHNNSVIDIGEIDTVGGDTNSYCPNQLQDRGLVCHTKNNDCCKDERGEWSFPGSNMIDEFCTIHDKNGISLLRQHINTNNLMPSYELLCCIIPDICGTNQTLCINAGKQ